jgi:hypothetical protein
MSRIKSLIELTLKLLALSGAIALAFGPNSVQERAEEAVFAAWRAVGDQLVKRELTAIEQQLDCTRDDAEKIRAARDRVATKLIALEMQRQRLAAAAREPGSRYDYVSSGERAMLDRAISMLKVTANRADFVLTTANDELRARQSELIVLQADHDARRLNQAIARPMRDRTLWSSHVERARIILGPDSTERADRRTAFDFAGTPIVEE